MSLQDDSKVAEQLMSPHLPRLRFDIQARRVRGDRTPTGIEVPRSFPRACLQLTYWELPVVFGDVSQPELTFRPSQTFATDGRASRSAWSATPANSSRALRLVDVVVNSERNTYHVDSGCSDLDEDSEPIGRRWLARCDDAHRSSLAPCSTCAASLAHTVERVLGPVDQNQRRRLPGMRRSPSVLTNEPVAVEGDFDEVHTDKDPVRFGAPTRPDDPRFTVHNSVDWGTASYSVNSEEFLSETTDDDHDWRDAASRHLD